jgi:hypothetical protein
MEFERVRRNQVPIRMHTFNIAGPDVIFTV